MDYTCVDAFSGAGGLALGLKRAGFDVLLGFDNDGECIETQTINRKYFRNPALKADVDQMLNGNLLKTIGLKPGELFLMAGGPPCQGFSVQRIGQDKDSRNHLVGKFSQLIEEVRPKYFLMENVPGMTGKRGKSILEQVLRKMEESGYWIHMKRLDAQDFGVPQRRRRVIVVGESQRLGLSNFEFPAPITPIARRVTVRDTISYLPSPPQDGSDHPLYIHHRRDRLSSLNKQRLNGLEPGEGRINLPSHLLTKCHQLDAGIIGHRNVYGRMHWDEVAPTITARFDSFTRGKFGHPSDTRTISLREGALLQTFPEDFIFSGNKVEIARQIGNAVPPKLAEVLGLQLLKSYESKFIRQNV